MEAWKRLDLPEKLEVGPGDVICVLWYYLDVYRPKQVGAEGHDVTTCINRLGVGVHRDDGRVVRSKRVDNCVFQTR